MAPALDSLDLIARAVTPPGRPRRIQTLPTVFRRARG